MAKIYGLFGAMSGKVADVVMSVRNGQQIVRKYQPVVSNPKTQNQYTTRARFKLISQLAAIMAPVITIPRKGGVSTRNLFSKINFAVSSFNDERAIIDLNKVQLTSSQVAFPPISASRTESNIGVNISAVGMQSGLDVNRVVYAMFVKQADEKLRYVTSRVATIPGEYGAWEANDFPLINESVVIYAYGVRDNTENSRTRFGELEVPTAEQVAELVVSSNLTEADVTLTETRAITLAAVPSREDDNPEVSQKKKK